MNYEDLTDDELVAYVDAALGDGASSSRLSELVNLLEGRADRIFTKLGWAPTISFEEMITEMIEAERAT